MYVYLQLQQVVAPEGGAGTEIPPFSPGKEWIKD
jgi:hypothetical protein